MIHQDEYYMQRCIELARRGSAAVAPNPMVGCVIVHEGKVLSEGWHQRYGEGHAEANAINKLPARYLPLLKHATLYVNLEPCSHHGKTPPCCDLILSKGIRCVVVGMIDPFDKVSGNGIQKLQEGGVEVRVGVMEEACKELNRRFITYHRKKRPYIIFKWAQTMDGYIDGNRAPGVPPSWLTGPQSKRLVHKWRSEEGAILVGSRTAINDNPQLTNRLWMGSSPVRVTIDRQGVLHENMFLSDGTTPTIVFCKQPPLGQKKTIQYFAFEGGIQEILKQLFRQNIVSVMVEGGRELLEQFTQADCLDEARIFVAGTTLRQIAGGEQGEGVKAPLLPAPIYSTTRTIDGCLVQTMRFSIL